MCIVRLVSTKSIYQPYLGVSGSWASGIRSKAFIAVTQLMLAGNDVYNLSTVSLAAINIILSLRYRDRIMGMIRFHSDRKISVKSQ